MAFESVSEPHNTVLNLENDIIEIRKQYNIKNVVLNNFVISIRPFT
jgi:hypothetical protein